MLLYRNFFPQSTGRRLRALSRRERGVGDGAWAENPRAGFNLVRFHPLTFRRKHSEPSSLQIPNRQGRSYGASQWFYAGRGETPTVWLPRRFACSLYTTTSISTKFEIVLAPHHQQPPAWNGNLPRPESRSNDSYALLTF